MFAKAAKGKGRQLDGQSVFVMAKLTSEASVSRKYVWYEEPGFSPPLLKCRAFGKKIKFWKLCDHL